MALLIKEELIEVAWGRGGWREKGHGGKMEREWDSWGRMEGEGTEGWGRKVTGMRMEAEGDRGEDGGGRDRGMEGEGDR